MNEQNPCAEMKTETVELIGIPEIFDFANYIREQAVAELKTDGHVRRVCWVFTTSGAVRGALDEKHIALEQVMGGNGDQKSEEAEAARKNPNTPAVVVVDLMPNEDGLLNMVCELFPKLAENMGSIMALGDILGVDPKKKSHHVMNALRAATGMNEQDIIGKFMCHMVKKLNGYAYVHVSETWHIDSRKHPNTTRKDFAKSLEDEPRAEEAIAVFTETEEVQQLVCQTFQRTERGKGKVINVDEPRTERSDQEEGARFVGRSVVELGKRPRA